MRGETRWLIAWLLISITLCLSFNLLTRSPVLDFSPGHIVIAFFFGLLITAVIFVIVTSLTFLASFFRS